MPRQYEQTAKVTPVIWLNMLAPIQRVEGLKGLKLYSEYQKGRVAKVQGLFRELDCKFSF